jgi:hypothetical protein
VKQKDLTLIIGIAIVSAILSLVISGKLFASPKDRQQQVQTIQAISTNFPTPSSKYFNSGSIDPTQLIQIGNNANQTPFNGGQ